MLNPERGVFGYWRTHPIYAARFDRQPLTQRDALDGWKQTVLIAAPGSFTSVPDHPQVFISKSNPFLSISRRYGIPYGTLLSYTDAMREDRRDMHNAHQMQAQGDMRQLLAGMGGKTVCEVMDIIDFVTKVAREGS